MGAFLFFLLHQCRSLLVLVFETQAAKNAYIFAVFLDLFVELSCIK